MFENVHLLGHAPYRHIFFSIANSISIANRFTKIKIAILNLHSTKSTRDSNKVTNNPKKIAILNLHSTKSTRDSNKVANNPYFHSISEPIAPSLNF
jgi:hypothetical protein